MVSGGSEAQSENHHGSRHPMPLAWSFLAMSIAPSVV
jgi:hypothetical protein